MVEKTNVKTVECAHISVIRANVKRRIIGPIKTGRITVNKLLITPNFLPDSSVILSPQLLFSTNLWISFCTVTNCNGASLAMARISSALDY
jgi:hypothetical protein